MSNVKIHPALEWSDLIAMMQRRRAAHKAGDKGKPEGMGDSSITNRASFTDGVTFAKALDRLQHGWIEGVQAAQAAMTVDPAAGEDRGMPMDVAGLFPVVPVLQAGDPFCMLALDQIETVRPRVALAFNSVYPGAIDAVAVSRYCAAVSTVLSELEAGGVDVALYAVDVGTGRSTGDLHLQTITVRAFGQPFDLSKVVVCFHPSFLRRVLFCSREMQLPYVEAGMAISGYGSCATMTVDHVRTLVTGGEVGALLPSVADLNRRGLLASTNYGLLLDEVRQAVTTAIEGGAQ
jgi:hypothetical protein